MSISISTNIVFPMSPLFFEMISSYFSRNLSKAFCVFGDMSLSFNSTFLCTGVFPGEVIIFLHEWVLEKFTELFLLFLSGIQFLGSYFPSCSMVQISNTSPSLQSFSAKATTWSLGRCKCS